jgi:acyl transferase domain-containing protein
MHLILDEFLGENIKAHGNSIVPFTQRCVSPKPILTGLIGKTIFRRMHYLSLSTLRRNRKDGRTEAKECPQFEAAYPARQLPHAHLRRLPDLHRVPASAGARYTAKKRSATSTELMAQYRPRVLTGFAYRYLPHRKRASLVYRTPTKIRESPTPFRQGIVSMTDRGW